MFSKDRRFTYGAGGALLAGLIATAALAADPAPAASTDATCPPSHRGDIDIDKMNARAAKTFESADANGDGKITQAEFLAAKPAHGRHGGPGPGMHGHGKSMGHHGADGGPTPQEREAFQADLYKALDADHNGQLSPAEFSKAWETARAVMKTQMFTKLDKNGDGVLAKDEFPPFVAKMSAMDTNGDGIVTRDERKAAHAPDTQTPPKPPTPQN